MDGSKLVVDTKLMRFARDAKLTCSTSTVLYILMGVQMVQWDHSSAESSATPFPTSLATHWCQTEAEAAALLQLPMLLPLRCSRPLASQQPLEGGGGHCVCIIPTTELNVLYQLWKENEHTSYKRTESRKLFQHKKGRKEEGEKQQPQQPQPHGTWKMEEANTVRQRF